MDIFYVEFSHTMNTREIITEINKVRQKFLDSFDGSYIIIIYNIPFFYISNSELKVR